MLKWYFKWKSLHKHKSKAYSLDARPSKKGLGPGFFGFLEQTRFYDSNLGKYEPPSKRRSILLKLLIVALIIGLGWFIVESFFALQLF